MDYSSLETASCWPQLRSPLNFKDEVAKGHHHLTNLFEAVFSEKDAHDENLQRFTKKLYHHFTAQINFLDENLIARIIQVIQRHLKHFQSEFFTILLPQGDPILIDKFTWALFSEYFNTFFSGNYSKDRTSLSLRDVDHKAFKTLQDYIHSIGTKKYFFYCAEEGVQEFCRLYLLADRLGVGLLKKDIEAHLLSWLKIESIGSISGGEAFYGNYVKLKERLQKLHSLAPYLSKRFIAGLKEIFRNFDIQFSSIRDPIVHLCGEDTVENLKKFKLILQLIPFGIYHLDLRFFFRNQAEELLRNWLDKGGELYSSLDLDLLTKQQTLLPHLTMAKVNMTQSQGKIAKDSSLKRFCRRAVNLKKLVLIDFNLKQLKALTKLRSLRHLHLIASAEVLTSANALITSLNEGGAKLHELTWPSNLFCVFPSQLKLPNLRILNIPCSCIYNWQSLKQVFDHNPLLKEIRVIGSPILVKDEDFYIKAGLPCDDLGKVAEYFPFMTYQIIKPLFT